MVDWTQPFQLCLVTSGFRFENLDATPTQVCDFMKCCAQYHEHNSSLPCSLDIYSGPNGRDLISMTSADFENLFNTTLNLSSMIFGFLTWQLTAQLVFERYFSMYLLSTHFICSTHFVCLPILLESLTKIVLFASQAPKSRINHARRYSAPYPRCCARPQPQLRLQLAARSRRPRALLRVWLPFLIPRRRTQAGLCRR